MAVFDVYVEIAVTERYRVYAATQDEAEQLAEELADEGGGELLEREIQLVSGERVDDEDNPYPEEMEEY